MKSIKLICTLCALSVIIVASIAMQHSWSQHHQGFQNTDGKENEAQGAKDAADYLWSLRVDPATGTINVNDMIAARKNVEAMAAASRNERIKSGINLTWDELGPDNIGGRTRAILFDKNNTSHMFAGSVAGGLWRSTNHGQSWYRINDEYQNLAVSCITQAANGDIYFGTGEALYGYFGYNVGGFPGQGIWKSTDGGNTFNRLGSTWDNLTASQQANWESIYQIYADPTNPLRIYAATGTGLRMSDDSGHSWINPVRNNMVGGLLTSASSTVKVATDGAVICTVGGQIYRSDSVGKMGNDSTFRKVTTVPAASRIELAVAPSNPNVMYACLAGGNTGFAGIYRTTDKFKTVTLIGPGGGSFNPLGQQGTYANCIAVCPDNADKVIVVGFDVYSWQLNQNWHQCNGYTSTNYVHPDHHTIVFNPSDANDFFIGCDGGLIESPDQGITFHTMNRKYNVTQFYAVAASPEEGSTDVTGGTQDNGCLYLNHVGNNPQDAINIHGGDGFYTTISYYNPLAYFVESQNAGLARSSNKGSGGQDFYDLNINPSTGLNSAFNTPFLLWENMNPNTALDTSFFIGTSGAVWMTKAALNFSILPKWFKIASTSGAGMCMAATNDGKTLFVGTSGNLVYRITNLDYVNNNLDNSGTHYDVSNTNTLPTPIRKTTMGGGLPTGRFPTSISVDPANNNHVLITYGNYGNYTNHVYESHNAMNTAPTFTDITHNIPAMPFYSSMIDRWDSTIMLVGTDLGVFATNDGGATWNYQDGLPRMPAFMIKQIAQYTNGNPAADIYIATHGRGLWKSSTLTGVHDLKSSTRVDINIYPNPTQDVATVSCNLNKSSIVILDIYNIQGQKIRTENFGTQASGIHSFSMNCSTIPSGTYFMNVTVGSDKSTKKFIIAR